MNNEHLLINNRRYQSTVTDTAVVEGLIDELYPFSTLEGGANVLVFPDLQSANVAYKLVQRLGGAEAVGPILTGMRKPVHVMQQGCETQDVVNMAAIAVIDAQEAELQRAEREAVSPETTGAAPA